MMSRRPGLGMISAPPDAAADRAAARRSAGLSPVTEIRAPASEGRASVSPAGPPGRSDARYRVLAAGEGWAGTVPVQFTSWRDPDYIFESTELFTLSVEAAARPAKQLRLAALRQCGCPG
eukprot:239390-Hanusia_phi.AAC.1